MFTRKASPIGLHTHDRGNPLCNPNAVYLASSATAPCSSREFEKQCGESKQKLNKSCLTQYGARSPAMCTNVRIELNQPIETNSDKLQEVGRAARQLPWEMHKRIPCNLSAIGKYITSHIMHRLASGTWYTNVFV